ncbi:MAG: metalloregulator ArsR/SmtB family transcription factor [Acidimicrobiia bacterium]
MSDPIRLSILNEPNSGQRCVCDLQEALDIAPNLMSYHLRILREAALVESARRGRRVGCRLSGGAATAEAGALQLPLLTEAL